MSLHPMVSACLRYCGDCMAAVVAAQDESPEAAMAARLVYERAERQLQQARTDADRERRVHRRESRKAVTR